MERVQPLQARLRVSSADDPFEREADRLARRVITSLSSSSPFSREDEHTLSAQRLSRLSAVHPASEFDAPAGFEQGLRASLGSGRPLPAPARAHMEGRFGLQFDDVRIHTDAAADRLSRSIHAQAFTHRNHIFFSAGQFNPNTQAGRYLLAHELAHVAQQTGAAQRAVQRAEDPAPAENPAASFTPIGRVFADNNLRDTPANSFKIHLIVWRSAPFSIREYHKMRTKFAFKQNLLRGLYTLAGGNFTLGKLGVKLPKNAEEKTAEHFGRRHGLLNNPNHQIDIANIIGMAHAKGHAWVRFSAYVDGQLKEVRAFGYRAGKVQAPDTDFDSKVSENNLRVHSFEVGGEAYHKALYTAVRMYQNPATSKSMDAIKFVKAIAKAAEISLPIEDKGGKIYPDELYEEMIPNAEAKAEMESHMLLKEPTDTLKESSLDLYLSAGAKPLFISQRLLHTPADTFKLSLIAYQPFEHFLELQQLRTKLTIKNKLRGAARKLGGKWLGVKKPKSSQDILDKAARKIARKHYQNVNEEQAVKDIKQQRSDAGHAWVRLSAYVKDQPKEIGAFGFYGDPGTEETPSPYEFIKGVVLSPDDKFDSESPLKVKDYTISRTAYYRALNKALRLYQNPPKYSAFAMNCTTFTKIIADAAGVSFPGGFNIVPFLEQGLRGTKLFTLRKVYSPSHLFKALAKRDASDTLPEQPEDEQNLANYEFNETDTWSDEEATEAVEFHPPENRYWIYYDLTNKELMNKYGYDTTCFPYVSNPAEMQPGTWPEYYDEYPLRSSQSVELVDGVRRPPTDDPRDFVAIYINVNNEWKIGWIPNAFVFKV